MSSLNEYGIIPECDIARADELARQRAEIEQLRRINQAHEMRLSVRGYEIEIADLSAAVEALKAERDEDRRREYGYSQQTVDALTQERDALRSLLERIVVAVDAGGVGFASNSEDFWNAIDAAREAK